MNTTITDEEVDELQKLVLLRTSIETQDPTSKEVDDSTLRRFLLARDSDIEKASSLFVKYAQWRREFVPNGFISEAEISSQLAQKCFKLQGMDKERRPIAVVFAGKLYPGKAKGGVDGFKRYVVYFLDKVCSRIPTVQDKFVIIADLHGWGYSNCDIRGYLAALSTLQDCYPERLGKLLIVNAPHIFMAAWKMIYPFIDNNTRKKITFVEKKNLKSTLLEFIDESQLPQVYGGKLPLVAIEDN